MGLNVMRFGARNREKCARPKSDSGERDTRNPTESTPSNLVH
jgi:hypothetical protein